MKCRHVGPCNAMCDYGRKPNIEVERQRLFMRAVRWIGVAALLFLAMLVGIFIDLAFIK